MKNGLVIADSGSIFSLAVIDKLDLLNLFFDEIKIPKAVWKEITLDENAVFFNRIVDFFADKICEIKEFNELTFVMDYGESEAVLLYKEHSADFLLIDDKKARKIAENFGINCIGTLGLLIMSKDKGYINELQPVFKSLIDNKRYYSLTLLNTILAQKHEKPIVLND
jgi:uncharacterized protein